METNKSKSADEYGMIINQLFEYEGLSTHDVEEVIISTVVPPITYTLQHLAQKYFRTRAIVVGPGIKTGLIVKYDNPKLLGADRIVNAVAALHKYPAPLIIVDFGTATTFLRRVGKVRIFRRTHRAGIKISADAVRKDGRTSPGRPRGARPRVCLPERGIQAGVVYGNMGLVNSSSGR